MNACCSLSDGRGGARDRAISEEARDGGLQVLAVHDHVEEPVLEEELARLEALGELAPDRVLDHGRPGEAEEGLRLGHEHVAQGGEGRHAAYPEK